MGELPPGRAMWEGGQAIDAYGTLARADAAPVLDRRTHRVDGGPLLRVVGDDAVPLHGGGPALRAGERVEPGARARLPHHRRLRPRRPLPAAARRPLLHGVLAGGEGAGRRRTPVCGSSRRCPTATTCRRTAGTIYEVRERRRPSRRCGTSRSSSTPTAGRSRSASADPGSPVQHDPDARRLGVPRGRVVGRPGARSTGRSPPAVRRAGRGCRRRRRTPRRGAGFPTVRVTDVHETDDSISFRRRRAPASRSW